jgi:hypothetical protein
MLWVDGRGRRVEVIRLDRGDGHGPRPWIRVSWYHRILLGRGYYRPAELDDVLALVDVETLVEIIELRPLARPAATWLRTDPVPFPSLPADLDPPLNFRVLDVDAGELEQHPGGGTVLLVPRVVFVLDTYAEDEPCRLGEQVRTAAGFLTELVEVCLPVGPFGRRPGAGRDGVEAAGDRLVGAGGGPVAGAHARRR